MGILYTLLVGLFIGWLAGIIVKGRGFGILGDIVIGVVGSFLGFFLAGQFGVTSNNGLGYVLISVGGAIILVIIGKVIRTSM